MARDSRRRRGSDRAAPPRGETAPVRRARSTIAPSRCCRQASTKRKPARTRPVTRRSRSDLRQLPVGQHFAQALALGLVVAGDQHVIVRRHGVQFVADPADLAAEALDRFDVQMTGRLDRGAGQGGHLDAGKTQQLLKDALHGEQPGHVGDALQVVLALLVQFLHFDQDASRRRRAGNRRDGRSSRLSRRRSLALGARP